jgi:GNAT superfamily N-acetyltransferase
MIIELLPPNTGQAFDAMRALRPALIDRDDFIQQVDQRQRPSGYRLIASLPDQEDPAVAVAGFRLGDNLAWGRHLYIDDVSTLPAARKRGHARLLLDWLHDEARRLECEQIHLDSGVGADRTAAHRLYFNAGFRISSHHFTLHI